LENRPEAMPGCRQARTKPDASVTRRTRHQIILASNLIE